MVYKMPALSPDETRSSLNRFGDIIRFDYIPENDFFLISVTEECDFDTLARKLWSLDITMNSLFIIRRQKMDTEEHYWQYDLETRTFLPSSREEVERSRQDEKPLTTPAGTHAHELVAQL